MPIAVSVATRSGLSAGDVAEVARQAEQRGVPALHIAETMADPFVMAQTALAATSALVVGTAIANARLRHPASAAMTTAALEDLFPGRFRLGLGISNARLNEGVLGMPAVRPVEFMRDYVHGVRRVLDGADDVPLDRAAGLRHLPVALAAMQPRMLRLAGAVADRAILSLTTTRTLPAAVQHVADGARDAGRDRAAVGISSVIPCCTDGGVDGPALEAGRGVVLGYARHPAAAAIFAAHGFESRLPLVVAALDRGDRTAASALVDPELVAAFVAIGPHAAVERVHAYHAAGVDEPILFPVPARDWPTAIACALDVAAGVPTPSTHARPSERVPT